MIAGLDKMLGQLERGKEAQALSPIFEEAQSREAARLIKRIFIKLDADQALDPYEAVAAWHELHALHRIERSLRKTALRGQRASAKLEPYMENRDGQDRED